MARPLDATQFRAWHRLRRVPWYVFIGLGAGLTTAGVVALNMLVTWIMFRAKISVATFWFLVMILVPVTLGAFTWTWLYMQDRYAATVDLLCPHCGYVIRSNRSARCPECGREHDRA